MADKANLEIRIRKEEERGYPIELNLNGVQQFQGGFLPLHIVPWVSGVSPQEDARRLTEALFADDSFKTQWARVEGQHPKRRVRLRIDPDASDLHSIPWEVLPLAVATDTPFSRYIPASWKPGAPVQERPLKMAVAIAAPENLAEFGLAEIDVDQELALLEEAMGELAVDLIAIPQPCTLSAIEAALQKGCHILHFVGHGQVSQRNQTVQLYLANEYNKVALVSAADFTKMLGRLLGQTPHDQPLRQIYLSSCQSATVSSTASFRGLAQQLIEAGLPAVLAMQDLMPINTDRTFSQTFYRRLLHHGQVDLAANEARASILTAKLPGAAIPVLYSRLPDNQLLTPSLLVQETAYREQVKARLPEETTYYIELSGRTTELPGQKAPAEDAPSARRRRIRPNYHQLVQTGQEMRRVELKTLQEGIDKYPCIILLGDPGSGKTTALQHLAHQLADDPDRLPLYLRLGDFEPGQTPQTFIEQQLRSPAAWNAPELAASLTDYLEAGRLFVLFDALNEMPRPGYQERTADLRDFIDRHTQTGNRFLVTCRVLDYGQELSGLQRVEIQSLTGPQIQQFLQIELPDTWQSLWKLLSEETTSQPPTPHSLLPHSNQRLLEMARNPYLLTMMIDVYLEEKELGHNRADLMARFTATLFERERTKPGTVDWIEAEAQTTSLARLAYKMQERVGSGATVATSLVKTVMPEQVEITSDWPPVRTPPDQVLTLAARANLIEMPVDRSSVRFYHQLLQEYFAAREMRKQDLAGLAGKWRRYWLEAEMPPLGQRKGLGGPLPPPPSTGWEETTILAAGLTATPDFENDDQLIRELTGINPVLAGRCLHEGRARVDGAIRQEVIEALLETISRPEVALRVRIAAGEMLGHLGDPRLGEMVTVSEGEFVMGGGRGQHRNVLPEYQLGKYPLTNAEFTPFIDAGGYRERRWWTEAGWQYNSENDWSEGRYWNDARLNKPNQPVVSVSWYEAVAYCRWLSAATGRLYRLPAEAEWEKGVRGVDGRIYPWGNDFDPTRLNAREGNQIVNATTPVGIYPTGISPFGAYDCAGNVWEWCSTQWGKSYPYDVNEDEWADDYLNRTDVHRVFRGGSWSNFRNFARCASRYWLIPRGRGSLYGFRVVSPI